MLSIAHFLEHLDDQVGFQLALNGCSRMKPSREPFKSGNAGPWYTTKTEYQRNRPHWKGSPEHLNCTHYLASESPISPEGDVLRVALLPVMDYPRRCTEVGAGIPQLPPVTQPTLTAAARQNYGQDLDRMRRVAVVPHCNSPKHGKSKSKVMSEQGLRFLVDGWEAQRPRANQSQRDFLKGLGRGHPAIT